MMRSGSIINASVTVPNEIGKKQKKIVSANISAKIARFLDLRALGVSPDFKLDIYTSLEFLADTHLAPTVHVRGYNKIFRTYSQLSTAVRNQYTIYDIKIQLFLKYKKTNYSCHHFRKQLFTLVLF